MPPLTVPPLPPFPSLNGSTLKDSSSTTTPPPTGTPSPTPTPTDPLAPMLNSVQPNGTSSVPSEQKAPPADLQGPRYAEYQSFCRTHEFDQVQFLSDSIKEKRIQLLQEKIKQEPESAKLKMRLLREFVDQKKIKEADQVLKDIRNLKISSTEINYAEAIYAFGKMDKKAARDILNKLLEEQPKNVDALKLLAEIYKLDANYFEYASIYYDLVKITKENYDEQLCEALTLDSHYADAEKVCSKGAAEGKNPTFAIYLGVAAREKENLAEAQKQFSNSLKIKESEMGYVCSGEISVLQKKYEAADEAFQKAIALNPKSLRAHLALAWSRFSNKDRTQALISFQNACLLNKKAASDLRKAIKILITEKSDLVKNYSIQAEKCITL